MFLKEPSWNDTTERGIESEIDSSINTIYVGICINARIAICF